MSRRGENIYKRKDGRWEGRYMKGKDLEGKSKYGYVYAKTYTEVKEKLKEIKSLPLTKTTIPGTAKTLAQVCSIWLDETKTQIKHSTYVKYYNTIYNHIVPVIGNYKIQMLDTVIIRQFADEKLTNGKLKGKGGLSPKTVKDILSVIRLVIIYANNIGITCNCRLDGINIKSADKTIDVLSKSQQDKLTTHLLNNIDNTNLGILICLYTGLRIGEICALKFEDISMIDKVIHIRKTMQRVQNLSENRETKTEVIVTSPKSKSSVRDIPLPEFIIQNIERENFYTPKAFLLSGDSVRFIEPRTLENRFKSCARMCGIENVNFHMLRHTFATRCVEVGFETKSLSEILGHSSVNITLNRYVHSSMELKRTNMEKLYLTPSF